MLHNLVIIIGYINNSRFINKGKRYLSHRIVAIFQMANIVIKKTIKFNNNDLLIIISQKQISRFLNRMLLIIMKKISAIAKLIPMLNMESSRSGI